MIVNMADAAEIIQEKRIDNVKKFKRKLVVGMCSGGFDPIHPGHVSYIDQAAHLCDFLVVVVNGDSFLYAKKGRPFMPCKDRCEVVDAIQGVALTVPFEIEKDMTVSQAIEILDPSIFFKGGDRTGPENIPEWYVCQENDVEIICDVGDSKLWSSRDYLTEWGNWYVDQSTAPYSA